MKNWPSLSRNILLSGFSITGLIILARLTGVLQPLEWRAFDLSLRWRPSEAADERITIVEITEEDLQTKLGHPISDDALARLIQMLQAYEPRAIGIDIIRDRPVGEGEALLTSVLESSDNVIGISRISSPASVQPHPALPESQIGFADTFVDRDGNLRQSWLGGFDDNDNYQLSLTVRMAEQYLAEDDLILENGIKDPQAMRFGDTEIPRLRQHTGGYVRTYSEDAQTLINFRANTEPFAKVSYTQLVSGQVNPSLLQDRALLIGYTAESVRDYVSSAAIAGGNPSLILGVDFQAHALSQILSAVYDDRSFVRSLPDFLEYVFILGSGLLGIALASQKNKPVIHFLLATAIGSLWVLLCYGLIIASWWMPLVPVLAAFGLNAIALYPICQAQRQIQAQIKERKHLIDWTYNTIHNGPLQRVARILSDWPQEDAAGGSEGTARRSDLEALNQELREIREVMRKEMLLTDETVVVIGHRPIDLQAPLGDLLYEVYQETLEENRSFFQSVIQIVNFEPMVDSRLTTAEKRELSRFLEEALLNLCKHAKTATRMCVDCRCEGDFNVIRVVDNGKGLQKTASKAYGTQQANRLARQLKGHFTRSDVQPRGVSCELRWPVLPSAHTPPIFAQAVSRFSD